MTLVEFEQFVKIVRDLATDKTEIEVQALDSDDSILNELFFDIEMLKPTAESAA